MIGPGWMPSRPRAGRRGLVPYLGRRLSRRKAEPVASAESKPEYVCGRAFEDRRAKLPLATLLPRRTDGKPQVLTSAAQRWLEQRWRWAQPRMIPLIVAAMGLIGMLNARRYLMSLARGPDVCVAPAPSMLAACAATPDLPSALHEH